MQSFQRKEISGKTRNLLLVTFLTLTFTALVVLIAVTYLNRNSREIYTSVDEILQVNTRSSELYKKMVSLELDIRDLITVILEKPYRLTTEKESLKEQFAKIQEIAGQGESNPLQQKLLKQFQWYSVSLDRLLWNYGELNSTLYEVYFYINNIKEQFTYMEEVAGQIMIDAAIRGENIDGLQQAYILIANGHEKILQIEVLVNSSLSSNTSKLLVADENEIDIRPEDTAFGKVQYLVNTLRTLTASDEAIASYATNIEQTIPLLEDNILDLSLKIVNLAEQKRLFTVERDQSLKLLEDLEAKNFSRVELINLLMVKQNRHALLMAWMISLVVVVVSIAGLILTRKMSRELEHTAEEALVAREAGEAFNVQLKREISEKRKIADDLAVARDELEQRVKNRTRELSNANRGLALEIEERKNAEYALASEKEQLTITLRSIGDGVITTGVDGTIVLINKVAEELTGWKQSEAVGKPLQEVFRIVCKQSGDLCENPVEILMRTGKIYSLAPDTVLISKDGSRSDISDSCAAIRDKQSNVIGAVLVFRDETEKRKMQEEALKSEKLKSVGVLAGGIAHDFNNILAAILGNISLAKLQIDEQSSPQTMKILEGAEKASLRARSLTQQLLTFSKGGEPVKKVESISEIVKDSADFILSGGKVQCEYDIEEGLWPSNIDTGQMSQVVQNIIINAMHAMPKGGKIHIICSNFTNTDRRIPSLSGEYYVKISIKDEGRGIPQELLDKVFDPYFTTKEEGSGLGLALTHSIVLKHNGYIEVDTGSWGTEFIIYLPALPGHEVEQKPPKAKVVASKAKANILIMDDEAMVREIAEELLVHLGYEVSTARNGEEALEIYSEKLGSDNPFSAVIMDLTIPGGMGGKEAIQKLHEIDPAVKGIVSSGYSNDPVMAEYEKYGFAGMVHKPFEIDELLETITKVIRSE